MNSTNTIFLKPGMSVLVDGVELSYEDIIESKIDSVMYREHIKELMEDKQ